LTILSFHASYSRQIDYLYNNFSNHFGKITFSKKTASKYNVYLPPKPVTHIGLYHLDNNFDRLDDCGHIAMVLGGCIAQDWRVSKKTGDDGIVVSSVLERPMYLFKSSLDYLNIEYISLANKAIIPKDSLGKLSTLYDKFIKHNSHAEQFLSGLNF